jgi:hypothetical protein
MRGYAVRIRAKLKGHPGLSNDGIFRRGPYSTSHSSNMAVRAQTMNSLLYTPVELDACPSFQFGLSRLSEGVE